MSKTENQKKLLKILNEIFQLDQSDLDFGIYRIMNTKNQEINEFLDKDLISSVAKAFSKSENEAEQNELDELKSKDTVLGYINGDESTKKAFENLDDVKRYILLNEKLSTATTSSNLENDVFSHLANFFKRYYKDGDFVSLRRYKKDTYAIPYEGEEVKLHWANSDQYYIKSGEYFRDYTFTVNDKTIHLKLSDAQTQSNNNKDTSDKERRFVILESNPCEVIEDELYINFEYKAIGKEKQDKLNEEAIAKALESIEDLEFLTALNDLAPTEKNKKRTIFEKHLKSYTSRNSFDYFIHKDLGGFLGRELDFYIKNEILFLDDIMDSPIKYDEVMGKIKIFKEVAQKIIDFVTQLEELQKKLWEKKKFIIETNYCITLDRIDENYYEEIFACDEQKAEWKTLFDVDVQSVDDLKEEKYLILDTKFFDMKFKYKLLSEFDNLDENIDGVLINSENFGALNLLQSRYKEQIKTVYIDPPYNTGNDGFLYNDNYQHSSWMSFMYDRLALGRKLMSDDGGIFNSIDDYSIENAYFIFNELFNKNNFISTIIWERAFAPISLKKTFSQSHDFLLNYAKNLDNYKMNGIKRDEENLSRYKNLDNDSRGIWQSDNFSVGPEIEAKIYTIVTPSGRKVLPPSGRCWLLTKERFKEFSKDNRIWYGVYGSGVPRLKRFLSESKADVTPMTIWKRTDVGDNQESTRELKNIFGQALFTNPKPLRYLNQIIHIGSNKNSIILDYFAGSGTTGHAVINLNREDNGKRKYILVEMGEYFDSVTKPRIQKVIYSDSWKDGKATENGENGISQIFKYFKLESYEDSLNNLEFKRTEEQQKAFDYYPEAKEDYILNYSLDVESQGSLLNIDTFSTPFDYKLKIATSSVGETKDTNIDLVETFNYLLGLVVKRMEMIKDYIIVEGQNLKGDKILIIWRDGQSNEKLNEFFKTMAWSSKDREFDIIYVNGDNNLDNLRKDEDHHKVKLIEQEFKKLMFGE